MAQSIRDFICECEMYPYSKACFDIMKECEEISLLNKILENHYVLTELGEFDHSVFTYTYETESDEKIQLIEESVKDKIRGVVNGILKMITALLDKIASFIQKRSNKIKTKIISNEMLSKLEQLPDEKKRELIEKYNAQKSKGKYIIKVKDEPDAPRPKVSIFRSMKALLSANKIMNESSGSIDLSTAWSSFIKDIKKMDDGTYEAFIVADKPIPNSMSDLVSLFKFFEEEISALSDNKMAGGSGSLKHDWAGAVVKFHNKEKDFNHVYEFTQTIADKERLVSELQACKSKINQRIDDLDRTFNIGTKPNDGEKVMISIRSIHTILLDMATSVLAMEAVGAGVIQKSIQSIINPS